MNVTEALARDASLAYLEGRVAVIEARVRAAVAHRRADDPNPDDGFRGLYVSERHVEELLSPSRPLVAPDERSLRALEDLERAADRAESAGRDLRLRRLQRAFGLTALDVELLLVALAPDLDPRFERLYGYLHDDITRRRGSVGLALELTGTGPASPVGRARLVAGAPLVDDRLIEVEDQDRPFLTRSLRLPDRVISFLLSDDGPDPMVRRLLAPALPFGLPPLAGLADALVGGTRLHYLREPHGTGGRGTVESAIRAAGMRPLSLDLHRLDRDLIPRTVAETVAREAKLTGATVVTGPVESLVALGGRAVNAFTEMSAPIVLTGRREWDPLWSDQVPIMLEAVLPGLGERASMWRQVLDGDLAPGLDPGTATAQFRLGAEQLARAAVAAKGRALYDRRPVEAGDLQAGIRAQNSASLERLARRLHPAVGWDDLVLPAEVKEQLRDLAAWSRHRERVMDDWGLRRGTRGDGATALFAGPSGTGKTMAAEALAGDLGLDLYAVDLATLVDKYIGETEKNLDRVFSEAEDVNGVLFFDEADALFGKRSEVRDAHDRYANIEVAYLLQRMEQFEGIAIMATNLRANLDEAFTRRLGALITFPMPDEAQRRSLWDRCLGPRLPRAGDVDLDFLASAFEISGGNIRNIAVAAAFLAADGARIVGMADLIQATAREFQKIGRLCQPSEFGPYFDLVG